MRMGTWAIVLAMSGSYPSAKGYREREMSKKAAAKIIAGLEDAVAYAKGDESRVRVTIIPSPKLSVVERLTQAIGDQVQCDATGLAPAVARVFLVGFDKAA